MPCNANDNAEKLSTPSQSRPTVCCQATTVPDDAASTSTCCDADLDKRGTRPCCKDGQYVVNLPTEGSDRPFAIKRVAPSWKFHVAPEVMRDIIIGLSDGLTVPFALTAGLSGTGSSRFVVLGGTAELVAGAISMGVGGYLSAKTERDHYRSVRRATEARVQTACTRELQGEVQQIMDTYGVGEEVSKGLCANLIEVEKRSLATDAKPDDGEQPSGITTFLLAVGEKMEPITRWRVYTSALTIGMAYMLGGLVPLLPYIFCDSVMRALFISFGVTGFTLLLFGAIKQPLVDRAESQVKDNSGAKAETAGWPWRDSAIGAVSMLAIGGAAAAASFGIVHAIEGHIHL